MKETMAVVGLLLPLVGCSSARLPVVLEVLDGSSQKLRQNFNADKDRPRAVALLSPL